MTEVDPAEKLLIDGDAYPLSSLMPVSYSETVEVSVVTYEQRSGSKLTLTAEVTSSNDKRLANKPTAFVITDTATGESFSIAVTTDANGTMTMEWTAPTQGVYTIHAAVTADGGYAASSSKTPVYYAALGKDTEGKNTTLYRLLLTENGKALGASVEYGADLTLQTQKWDGEAWTKADETVSYQAAAPRRGGGRHRHRLPPTDRRTVYLLGKGQQRQGACVRRADRYTAQADDPPGLGYRARRTAGHQARL